MHLSNAKKMAEAVIVIITVIIAKENYFLDKFVYVEKIWCMLFNVKVINNDRNPVTSSFK